MELLSTNYFVSCVGLIGVKLDLSKNGDVAAFLSSWSTEISCVPCMAALVVGTLVEVESTRIT